MSINARLDETRSEKLEYLKQATGAGTTEVLKTEVLKQAIDLYYREIRGGSPASAPEILAAFGFIGSGEGTEALSETYKELLASGQRLAQECAKLQPEEQQALAEERFAGETEWPAF